MRISNKICIYVQLFWAQFSKLTIFGLRLNFKEQTCILMKLMTDFNNTFAVSLVSSGWTVFGSIDSVTSPKRYVTQVALSV